MDKSNFLITVTVILASSWLAFSYNPKINFSLSPQIPDYLISLDNIDVDLQGHQLFQGRLKAASTIYHHQGCALTALSGHLDQNNQPLLFKANKGFWPHTDQKLYLYDNVVLEQGDKSLRTDQLVIDFREGTCWSDTPATWSVGNIQAISDPIHEKMEEIYNKFFDSPSQNPVFE